MVTVLTALAVHCYHRWRGSACAQHARDSEAATRIQWCSGPGFCPPTAAYRIEPL